MDLEQLIEQVAERVVAKLLATNRVITKKPRTPPNATMSNVLDSLVAQQAICTPKGNQLTVKAITQYDLVLLLEMLGAGRITSATLTAALKARGVAAYVSEFSKDSRNRFSIRGRQTRCFVFDNSIDSDEKLLAIVDSKF